MQLIATPDAQKELNTFEIPEEGKASHASYQHKSLLQMLGAKLRGVF